MKKKKKEIKDYDSHDVTEWIDPSKEISLKDLGFTLPPDPPTQVVSIRIPTRLLNKIKSVASFKDVPYQALIKLALSSSFEKKPS